MKIPEILMVETVHQPGSLARVLQVIAEAGLIIDHLNAVRRERGRTLNTQQVLRDISTPGVARVCLAIRDDPTFAREYTSLDRTVAVVTSGTAVLGLGNIGALRGGDLLHRGVLRCDPAGGRRGTGLLRDGGQGAGRA